MLGFRGASRYIAPEFYDCFELECQAMKRVRDDMGLTNVEIMIPFVRTLAEAEQVIALLAKNGLERGDNGLRADHDVRDSVERDSRRSIPRALRRLFDRLQRHDATDARRSTATPAARSRRRFDERDDAVKAMLAMAIAALPARRASMPASAARVRPTIPISRSGWSSSTSRAFRSTGHRRRYLARAGREQSRRSRRRAAPSASSIRLIDAQQSCAPNRRDEGALARCDYRWDLRALASALICVACAGNTRTLVAWLPGAAAAAQVSVIGIGAYAILTMRQWASRSALRVRSSASSSTPIARCASSSAPVARSKASCRPTRMSAHG